MVIICNKEEVEGMSYQTWNKVLTERGKEVLLDCLEAGLDAYEDDEDMEACNILNELIGLLNKEEWYGQDCSHGMVRWTNG